MNPITIFTALDLELNQPSRKIIQIGIVIGDIQSGRILEKISVFVNPNENLHPAIVELTGIKQKDVNNGVTLMEAYDKIRKAHENYGSFINCLTWGGNDTQELLEQLKQENPNFDNWCFGRRVIDVKTLFVAWRFANLQPIQGGLARSMTKVGLKFNGKKHNAADDAENTFNMYMGMLCLLKKDMK